MTTHSCLQLTLPGRKPGNRACENQDRLLARSLHANPAGEPTTLIAVKNIPDPSGLFSTGTKEMLITALSRMSRTSQAFRVVDYEVDALRQDTVQTLTSLLLNNNQMELRKPQIYISGAISFGDKTVVSKRQSLGVSTAATDTGHAIKDAATDA